jgi:hypothetical protein
MLDATTVASDLSVLGGAGGIKLAAGGTAELGAR